MSYQKVDCCPICNSSNFSNYLICEDYTVSRESFALVKCNDCSFCFTNPRPDPEHIGQYYKSEDYISHTNKNNSLINIVYKLVRLYTLKKKVKLINKYSSTKGAMLDYGCGTGNFLEACQKNGWQINGIEPDDDARAIAQSILGTTIHNNIEQLQNQKYQVITLWHVLEHIHDLNNTFQTLIKKLDKDGVIIVAVPNYESYDATHYQAQWAGYDVPRHLYHFTQSTIKSLFKKYKLKQLVTLPMVFDAYYVSMLSEKYKTGKSNLISAFKTGYQSNKAAKANNNNYSSLIYIAKK